MSIKNLKPNSKSRYKQGYFDKYKPCKYIGPRPIIFRSSLELRFMQKLELNPNVLKWSSENMQIPYFLREQKDGKFVDIRHTYNIDFTVFMKNGNRYVVEVKPSSLTPLNESQIKRNPIMYKNACKWKAAIEWCKKNNYKFIVVTEKHLETGVFS